MNDDDILTDTITITSGGSGYSSYNYDYTTTGGIGTITLGGAGASGSSGAGMAYTTITPTYTGTSTASTYTVSNGTWGAVSPIVTSSTGAGITVKGDAEFDGSIKWKGKDLGEALEKIEKRLSILTPDPKKLEKYEALQKAYNHYKMLEALCEADDGENE